MSLTVPMEVAPRDREVLETWLRAPSMPAGMVARARIVVLAADGVGTNEICRRVGVTRPTVGAWQRRYAVESLGGLEDRPRSGKPRSTDDVAIVLRTLEPPPERLGVTHWSSRLLARELGLSNVKVADVWREQTSSRRSPDNLLLSSHDPNLPASRRRRGAPACLCGPGPRRVRCWWMSCQCH